MSEPLRVLAIDGGGIRGIIPATVLAGLEDRADRPVAELFDLLVGTSTGGILALALSAPDRQGRPRWRAEELVALYRREGPRIFSRSVFDRIRSVEGALDEKYPSRGLIEVLGRYFGELRLRDALVEVVVTAYETELRAPFFFRSGRAHADAAYDFPMRDAAHATSAAPTYFEPVRLGPYTLIDGGVYAANPAMCAVAEVLRREDAGGMLLVSLGTGQHNRPLPWARIKDWGALEWARPVLDVIFDGTSDVVDFQARQILGRERYWRLQTELGRASDDLDDARAENLDALEEEAGALVERESATLERVVAVLRR